MNTDTFIQQYFDSLSTHDVIDNKKWNEIVQSIKKNQYMLQNDYESLEELLIVQLSKLDEQETIDLYKETEQGSTMDEEKEEYSTEFLNMVLVEELMDIITSTVWEQAGVNH